MTPDEKAKAQRFLEMCADFNGGHGLCVPEWMADKLKSNGIDGPYFETPKLNEKDKT